MGKGTDMTIKFYKNPKPFRQNCLTLFLAYFFNIKTPNKTIYERTESERTKKLG